MKYIKLFEEFTETPLNEAFQSSILTKMAKTQSTLPMKDFFTALSQMGVALSEVTDLHMMEVSPDEAKKISKQNPNAVLIYWSDREKTNPYSGEYIWDKTIKANSPVAIVKGNLFMGLRKNKQGGVSFVKLSDSDYILQNPGIAGTGGKYGTGITSLIRAAEVSDMVYVIDPSLVPSNTKLKEIRRELKSGAIAFLSDKDFKSRNQARYQAILRERASSDEIDKIVQSAIDEMTEQIKQAIVRNEKGKYGGILIGLNKRGREVSLDDAGNFINNILRTYARYVEYINSSKEEESRWGNKADGYYTRQSKELAKQIKDAHRGIKDLAF